MKHIITSALAAAVLALTACGSRGPAVETLDADALFERGQDLIRDGKWTEAAVAFERFTYQFPTHQRVQEARYLLAESYVGKEEYITAANEYARLAADFPAGPWADDARFKVCESYWELSPRAQLDQEYTQGAIEHCQSLLAYYPDSEYAGRAREMIATLTDKLANKLFLTGEYYFKRDAFDSAIIYYDQVLREYPQTPTAPRALLRLYETYTTLGYADDAATARTRLLSEYPQSSEASRLGAPTAPPTN